MRFQNNKFNTVFADQIFTYKDAKLNKYYIPKTQKSFMRTKAGAKM